MAGERRRLREHGNYWLEQHENSKFYVALYDDKAQQTRRRSLRTSLKAEAIKAFDRMSASSNGGDPRPTAEVPTIVTVRDLMEWYAQALGRKLAAKAQLAATVRHVGTYFGRRGVSCLGTVAVEAFVEALRCQGLSLGYAARICAQLRTAVRSAHKRKLIPEAYDIPNPQSKAERDATPRKGRPMAAEEIAKLIDAMVTRHMVNYMKLALSTVGRRGALLDFKKEQYHVVTGLLYLNPEDRVQTTKYRPTLIAIEQIRPWLQSLPPGFVVTTDLKPGERVGSIKTAWRASCRRAGFDKDVTTYSIRYAVAMYMRVKRVPTEQISVTLGHMPVNVKAVTLDYSPYDPTYLREATAAIAEFYETVDRLVTNPLWRSW